MLRQELPITAPLLAHSDVQAGVYTVAIALLEVGGLLIHKLFLTIEEIVCCAIALNRKHGANLRLGDSIKIEPLCLGMNSNHWRLYPRHLFPPNASIIRLSPPRSSSNCTR